jgi:ubiquinone/menaquinone biosynthesis C-methylase UbiE
MMKLYERFILPKLVHASCGTDAVMQQRSQVVPEAAGRVLEIGFGSGLNLSLYDPRKVERLWALEPSPEMWAIARERVEQAPFPVEHLHARAEDLSLEDASIDTVLTTFTLCTIADVPAALEQIRRVLKPGGRMLFCEHGASPDAHVLKWQNRLDPVWTRLAGGCHLNRRTRDLLEQNGFTITSFSAAYIPGWKVDSFIYYGTAEPVRTA